MGAGHVFPARVFPVHLEPEHRLRPLPAAARAVPLVLAAAAVVSGVSLLRQHRHSARRCATSLTVALTLAAIAPPAYTAIRYDANAAKVWTTRAGVRVDSAGACPPARSIRARGLAGDQAAGDRIKHELREAAAARRRASSTRPRTSSTWSPRRSATAPTSSTRSSFPPEYADYQRIFAQTEEVARFTPTSDHPGSGAASS